MRKWYLLLFLSSACLMTVELVAGRIIAPFLGVSLYTWTGIIGACLTGMSFGHLGGGWLADRGDPRRWLPAMFLAAAALTGLLVVARPALGELTDTMRTIGVPPLVGIFAVSTLFFGVPCLFLAAVSPLVYKLALQNQVRVGGTVGRLAASGVAGSILGTYATGFWLVPAFGTRAILVGITTVLAAMGSYTLVASPVRRAVVTSVVVAVLAGAGWPAAVKAGSPCTVESAYYCIRVQTSDDKEYGPVKKLRLDFLTHSGYRINKPDDLWYEYEQVVGWILQARNQRRFQMLFLGGGGYILPHWVEREFARASVDVVEVDPEVTRVALKEFAPGAERIRSINQDAREALRDLPPDKAYNVIFGDVFSDLSVPYHLTTLEFAQLVRSRLTEDGLYLVNVVDQVPDGPLVSAMAATLKQVFPHVDVLPGVPDGTARGPLVIAASGKPLPWDEWDQHTARPLFVNGRISPAGRPLILTDDYVPTDALLLPVFHERWQK